MTAHGMGFSLPSLPLFNASLKSFTGAAYINVDISTPKLGHMYEKKIFTNIREIQKEVVNSTTPVERYDMLR